MYFVLVVPTNYLSLSKNKQKRWKQAFNALNLTCHTYDSQGRIMRLIGSQRGVD